MAPKLKKCGCSSMVEFQPSKLVAWVRFPSPAPPFFESGRKQIPPKIGEVSSMRL